MEDQEKKESALRILLDLAVKIQSGEALIEDIDMRRQYICVQEPNGRCEFFGIFPMTLILTYQTRKNLIEERIRYEQYLKDHPDAKILGVSPDH